MKQKYMFHRAKHYRDWDSSNLAYYDEKEGWLPRKKKASYLLEGKEEILESPDGIEKIRILEIRRIRDNELIWQNLQEGEESCEGKSL